MATTETAPPGEEPLLNEDAPSMEIANDANLKRKAQSDADDDHPAHGSPKRVRQDEPNDNNDNGRGKDAKARRDSSPPEQGHSIKPPPRTNRERRESSQLEEKKRNKRLFGGLLSTIGQTSSNPQHKRRQEIERRQQDRLQKQKDEDDEKRSERLSYLHNVRMAEQIVFDEEVMRIRHSKMLSMAQFLRTRARPYIYYLPWKPTLDQEDLIDDQVRDAKSIIDKEAGEFKAKKEAHILRYGPSKRQPPNKEEPVPVKPDVKNPEKTSPPSPAAAATVPDAEPEKKPVEDAHQDIHDESGDVVVDAEEDMVIY